MKPSRPATALIDFLCSPATVRNDASRGRVGRVVRRSVLRITDPDVTVTIDGTRLVMPLSHDLPVNRAHYPQYSANLGTIASAVKAHRLLDRPLRVIDVGANIGDSVAVVLARTAAEFLCVEGDHTFLPYLRENTKELAVTIEDSYLESEDVPLAGKSVIRDKGTARLAERGESADSVHVSTMNEVVGRHPEFAQADLVKIDTDGHDGGIIRAAASWLTAARPVLFFELDPRLSSDVGARDIITVFDTLRECGYRDLVVYDNLGYLVGKFSVDDPELRRATARLGTASHPPYWDVVALVDSDSSVARMVMETV